MGKNFTCISIQESDLCGGGLVAWGALVERQTVDWIGILAAKTASRRVASLSAKPKTGPAGGRNSG